MLGALVRVGGSAFPGDCRGRACAWGGAAVCALAPGFLFAGLLAGAISALLSADVLAPGAILVCEHGSDETVAVPEGFFVRKSKKCGEVSLTVLQEKTA
mgnify:CR=1 FL=1